MVPVPPMNPTELSSNWKKLQKTLQSEKKDQPTSNGLKRKRQDEKTGSVTGFKKAKVSAVSVRKRKMGLGSSKPEQEADKAPSNLIKQDAALDTISPALDTPLLASRKYTDDVNGGLHPTHKVGRYISLDCEMVGTGPPPHLDHVLARASIVNFNGEQIYDSYVLPPPGIDVKDYRTFVSGIKPSHLIKGYARPFAEVQKDVADLLDDRILIGHALRNDLNVLLLSHPKRDLRDTSRHPKFRVASMGKTPALRNLAKSELGMEIQTGSHSSIEDARATMMLFRKEKAGFEEENRKHFGQHKKFERKASKQENSNGRHDDESEDEDEDDEELDLSDGEANNVADEVATKQNLSTTKKRKKKKRTKRK